MSSPDNAVPIVGDVNKTLCYLVNYTPINNSSNNSNNGWISSVLSYNTTTTPTSSDGGDRIYFWSQAQYCAGFGLSKAGGCNNCINIVSSIPCNNDSQCIFDSVNDPTCGCLFYSPSSSCGEDDVTYHINNNTNCCINRHIN